MLRQFNTVPMVCPHCGHVLGEQAYFQSFEMKVAGWLQGKVAPTATPGYDVYDTASIPGATFQVKYAHVYERKAPHRRYPSLTWAWIVKRSDIAHPDFFVLFGVDQDGTENCFLMSRHDFLSTANLDKKTGVYKLLVTAKRHTDRKNYRYIPRIWQYYVPDPEQTLLDRVLSYQPGSTYSMFMQKYLNQADEIKSLQQQGLSQKAIAQQLGVSQTTVHRVLKGGAR